MSIKNFILKIKYFRRWFLSEFPQKTQLGYCAKNVRIEYPLHIESPKNVFIYENTYLRNNIHIINAPNETVIIKKNCALAANVSIITNNHKSIVSVPTPLLVSSHINDISQNITIESDVWVGYGATILSGGNLNRGCIVGAKSLVTKPVPPYAVVAGIPAKIIAVRFSIEQILEHEKIYTENERYTIEELQKIFMEYYTNIPIYGDFINLTAEQKAQIKATKLRISFID